MAFKIHWSLVSNTKSLAVFIFCCDSFYRRLWLHCHLHYHDPRIGLHPWNNPSGKMWCLHSSLVLSHLSCRKGFSFQRKEQSEVRRSKYLGNLFAGDKHLAVPVTGVLQTVIQDWPVGDQWQHSAGQALPFSLTSFKIWINLLIYWRSSMETN